MTGAIARRIIRAFLLQLGRNQNAFPVNQRFPTLFFLSASFFSYRNDDDTGQLTEGLRNPRNFPQAKA